MAKRPYHPGARAEAILEAFGRYHFLTGQQVIHLLLRPSIRSNGYLHLKELTDHGYLALRDWLPPPPGASGKSQTGVWSVGVKGRTWLQARELPVLPPRKASDGSLESQTLRHLLAINDCLIELERFCAAHGAWMLLESEHDLLLKRRQLPAIPDAYTRLQKVATASSPSLWWEIDYKGKQEEKRWKQKIAAIVACYQSGKYQEAFGTQNLTVAVVAYQGDARRNALVRWTEEALTVVANPEWGKNFRFTSCTPPVADPAEFISDAHWVIPFAARAVPLIAR